MVNDQQGLNISPLQAKYMAPPPTEPPNKRQHECQLNSVSLINEYELYNSEDEFDGDNKSIHG